MKTYLLITLSVITGIFLGALIMLMVVVNLPMSDLKLSTVRYECPYEYGECPNKGCSQNISREYQFNISDEGTEVYQGERLVGFLPLDTTQQLDKLMMFDNQ